MNFKNTTNTILPKLFLSIFIISIFLLNHTLLSQNTSQTLAQIKKNKSDPNQITALETASLSGLIVSKGEKETIIGATIKLKDTKLGAYSNKSGFYTVKNIPAGKYTLVITYVGYDKYEKEVTFTKNENKRLDIELSISKNLKSKEVNVIADKFEDKKQITISKVNIPIEQLKEIRIGGESDVFRSLQLLPGILTSSQISSGLYVRGGSPDQNLILLDGSTVYNPTHLFGFISTFNSEAIKDVELIKGGFPAEYGGRMSSVLTITQKDGNREKVGGNAGIGLLSSKLALEGPLGNGSWFIGGRRSYFDLIKSFVKEDPTAPLPDYNFYDVNAKITQDLGENDKIFLSGFLSSDLLNFSSFGVGLNLTVGNKLAAFKWQHIDKDYFTTLNVSASQYINNFVGGNSGYNFLVENSITDYSIKGNFEWYNSDELTTKYGFEINNYNFQYLSNFTGDTDSTQQGSGSGVVNFGVKDINYAMFAQSNYQLDSNTSFQLGIRGSYFNLAEQFRIDPRFAFKHQINDDIAIKGAWGIFHQNLKLATQPDFSFFDTWLGTDSTLNISRSMHYIISLETKPADGYDLNFDIYYKTLEFINELNRFALQIENGADALYEGNGEAYGAELFLQRRIGKFTGWAGYGFGFVFGQFDSINFGNRFRPKYDRRHDIKIVAQYELDEDWEIGANFTFQSGQSYTGVTSMFVTRLPGMNFGRTKTIPSERYGLRLPNTHQLNVNASYKFDFWGAPSRVIFDIYNVYNRRDIWFRFYDTTTESGKVEVEDVRLLPIIPSISLEIKF